LLQLLVAQVQKATVLEQTFSGFPFESYYPVVLKWNETPKKKDLWGGITFILTLIHSLAKMADL